MTFVYNKTTWCFTERQKLIKKGWVTHIVSRNVNSNPPMYAHISSSSYYTNAFWSVVYSTTSFVRDHFHFLFSQQHLGWLGQVETVPVKVGFFTEPNQKLAFQDNWFVWHLKRSLLDDFLCSRSLSCSLFTTTFGLGRQCEAKLNVGRLLLSIFR